MARVLALDFRSRLGFCRYYTENNCGNQAQECQHGTRNLRAL